MFRVNLERLVACTATFALLAGCASTESPSRAQARRTPPPPQISSAVTAAATGARVAMLARSRIGTPYRYGGADPTGFDCSGLVYWSYRQAGVEVPRTSQAQFKAAVKIAPSTAVAGDLLFFQDQQKLSHVGIYLGDGLFVHAPETGAEVRVASVADPYYQAHLIAVGRLLPSSP